jgi:hypothetical protein
MCAPQRALVATCPIFDAATLVSIRMQKGLDFLKGGSARCSDATAIMNSDCSAVGMILRGFVCRGFGRCNSAGCINPLATASVAVPVIEGPVMQSTAVYLKADQGWILVPSAPKFANMSAFTVEVRRLAVVDIRLAESFVFCLSSGSRHS